MPRIRRPRFVCFFSEDFPFPDFEQLLRGRVEQVVHSQIGAFSILRGETVELTLDELEFVLATPSSEWVESSDGERARSLGRRGVLLVDEPEGELAELRRRDEQLTALNWNLESAVYHFIARWRGIDLREGDGDLLRPSDEEVREFVAEYGMPPPAFHAAAGFPRRRRGASRTAVGSS